MIKILMNKDKEVLKAEYDPSVGGFIRIYEVYDINYAPYISKKFLYGRRYK